MWVEANTDVRISRTASPPRKRTKGLLFRLQNVKNNDATCGVRESRRGGAAPGDGYFIKPTVIADVKSDARIFQEEIFGPVLAVTKAKDFEHALDLANDSQYGLTGAVFSNNPEHIREARERFFVGNLYLNRKCTGAMVGAHPFGGFNMSGTDSKAGGPDYLLLFLQAKSIAERVA